MFFNPDYIYQPNETHKHSINILSTLTESVMGAAWDDGRDLEHSVFPLIVLIAFIYCALALSLCICCGALHWMHLWGCSSGNRNRNVKEEAESHTELHVLLEAMSEGNERDVRRRDALKGLDFGA
ncbi:hypothetical protein K458DRAFT_392102 [Lentithecium fluviatile CBS 122367]|uniref:Uncharacterized protein n=1 Tax=Lentithecium fluviatile CBS 122367 TaxID=1168545 RepID=A0A6G1ITN5_9PLEO|nr:hypothetical protein K458DRAFT_392102 [Lentithecium fluviatile CBS 122367]